MEARECISHDATRQGSTGKIYWIFKNCVLISILLFLNRHHVKRSDRAGPEYAQRTGRGQQQEF